MKKFLSIISVLLTLTIVFALFAIVPFAANADSKPCFVVSAVEAEAGTKNVAVNVSIKNNPGIASVLLDIGYDKSVLTLKNFVYNSTAVAGSMTVPFNENAKQFSLSMVNGTSNIEGDFVFATLYFDVATNASGSYPITLSYDENNVYDINEDNVEFAVIDGSITVDGEVLPTNPTDPSEPTEPDIGDLPAFVVSKVEADAGAKNVAVTVSLENNPGIASVLLDIGYDKSVLTLKGFTYNTTDLVGTMTVPFNASASQYSLSMVSGTSNIEGDFVFATLYFDVADNASGKQTITLSYDENNVYDISENNINFAVVNGSITVNENAHGTIGDVNKDETIDILDAVMVQKHAVDRISFDDEQKYVADVNGDGTVDILDATQIQKYATGKITEFKKKA